MICSVVVYVAKFRNECTESQKQRAYTCICLSNV